MTHLLYLLRKWVSLGVNDIARSVIDNSRVTLQILASLKIVMIVMIIIILLLLCQLISTMH